MKLPKRNIGAFAQELTDHCLVSQKSRADSYRVFKNYYQTGSSSKVPAIYNRCFVHIDRTSSYLFSPAGINFAMDFDDSDISTYIEMGVTAARVLTYEFSASGSDMAFSAGVSSSLIKGSSFFKTVWGNSGFESSIIQPEMMGVYREDINHLDRQEAFVQCMLLTETQLKRLVSGHPEEKEILHKAKQYLRKRSSDEEDFSLSAQLSISGFNPITYGGSAPSQARGSSNWLNQTMPILSPEIATGLIPLFELWVQDSERQDWTTIQFIDSSIVIEGKLRHRNLSGVKGETGFTQICPNYTQGYFWGASELSPLLKIQNMLDKRMQDVDKIFRLRANPPRAIIGSSGLSQEQKTAMGLPNGIFTEPSPNVKIESMAPDLPPEAFEQINQLIYYFDDVAGFKPILGGEGEPGVRAGSHAETLVRNASPRMRDRAILIERQCSAAGHYAFKLMQNKDPNVYKTSSKKQFLLSQIPDDFMVTVDSHSTSPAFVSDAVEKATLLLKAGAISKEDFIRIIHPPFEDVLAEKARQGEKSAAEMRAKIMQIAEKDPTKSSTLLAKLLGKK